MPEADKGAPAAPEAKAVLPPTEAERRKARFDKLAQEPNDKRSERRAGEFKVHLDVHFENVAEAHESYPTPDMAEGYSKASYPFEEWTREEQTRWNEKRKQIDSANRAYHLAVRRTFVEHVAEDNHLAKVRAAAKPAAA
jgi:hypothetical protein